MKGFTGRQSLVANTVSIFMVSARVWETLGTLIHYYVVFGLLICLFAFLTYISETTLPVIYYRISWLLYNSVFAGYFVWHFG